MDAEIEESDALADLEAYYARKTADEYENICKEAEEAEEENEELVDEDGNPVFYVVPDGSERRRQIDSDNYSQLYNFRKEITDKKTADSKKADEDARNAENADRVKYITDKIAVQTTYELAIANAEETYYSAVTTADAAYNTTVESAEENYSNEYCRLTGLYYDALQTIDTGGTIEENYYENGTSSLNVQVCFPAGTPVILADGSTKNIEDIVVGDSVKTVNHQNPDSEIVSGKVVQTFQNKPQALWRLNFGTFEVRATKEHPFFVKGKGWTAAQDLQVGDICRSADNSEVVLITKEFEPEQVPVFNFEVEGKHTYFVGENEKECVLVHNECELWNRFVGGLMIVGGIGECVIGGGATIVGSGGTVASGGTASPISVPVILGGGFLCYHGSDTTIAGLRQIWSGETRTTLTSNLITQATGSRMIGEVVDTGIGIVAPVKFANVVRLASLPKGANGGVLVYRGMRAEEFSRLGNTMEITGRGGADAKATPLGQFWHSCTYEDSYPFYKSGYLSTTTSYGTAKSFAKKTDEIVAIFELPAKNIRASANLPQSEILVLPGTPLLSIGKATGNEIKIAKMFDIAATTASSTEIIITIGNSMYVVVWNNDNK